jgi:excisionase family DNA binding protein
MEVKTKQIEELKNQIEQLKTEVENIKQLFSIQKNVLNFSEVKLYTNLSTSYLYQLTSTGGIPCYKPSGKHLYFKRDEVEKWLLSNRRATNIELDELASTHISIA